MDYPALAHAIADVRSTAEELDRGRTTLHQSFGSFLGGEWTGQAAESFVGGWDDWSEGVAAVLDALRSIADLLEQHGTDLRAQDAGSASTTSHLHTRLGVTGGSY